MQNLYYWSSVNPQSHNGHAEKLISFGNAVRAHGGSGLPQLPASTPAQSEVPRQSTAWMVKRCEPSGTPP